MSKDDFDWIRLMLEKIDDRQDEQALTLARLTVSVEEHVKRTNLLESELKPIKKHIDFVGMAVKAGSALIGVLVGLKSLGLLILR